MASTPSASALSAVLRCRGNIWTRNPPTKRPVSSVYSRGTAGGVLRDSSAERTRSKVPAWDAFLQGERVVVGRRLTVACKSPRVEGEVLREKDSWEIAKSCHPKLSQSSGVAHVSGAQSALVRQLARRLSSNLRGIDKCSQIISIIKYKTYATHICKVVFVQEIGEFPAGVLKVSITPPRWMENTGQMPSFVFTGWSTVKSTCLSLTALVSELMFVRRGVLCSSTSGPDDVPQHLLNQKDEENIRHDALQADGQIHSPTDLISAEETSGSAQSVTEDRPDWPRVQGLSTKNTHCDPTLFIDFYLAFTKHNPRLDFDPVIYDNL